MTDREPACTGCGRPSGRKEDDGHPVPVGGGPARCGGRIVGSGPQAEADCIPPKI